MHFCTFSAMHFTFSVVHLRCIAFVQHSQLHATLSALAQLHQAINYSEHPQLCCIPANLNHQDSPSTTAANPKVPPSRCMYSGWGSRYRDTSENYVFLHCGIDPASGLIRSMPLRHRGDLPAISSVDLAALQVTTWQRFFVGLPAVAARRARAAPSWQRLSNSLIVATARTIKVVARWIALSHHRITWAETIWWRIWPGRAAREGLAALPAIHW